ncbi:hypothetical protein [Nocardia arizonensis]|uniref:hypothetical protein n=1 Tax=Nocardia arizonensis TaxID=1141647 RepID=UPI0006CFFD24|nr:hypothetical protein [Nocardia arizonensis]
MSSPVPSLLDLAAYQALAAGTGLEYARLAGIVREIRDYCGWHIAPAIDDTMTVDGSGGTVQQLPTLALNSVASITENGTALETTAYEWSRDGSLRRCGYWTTRYRGVVAVVNHGFAEVPENLVSVILDAASLAIATPVGTAVVGDEPEKMGPFEWGARTDRGVVLTASQRRVLDRYRIPSRA